MSAALVATCLSLSAASPSVNAFDEARLAEVVWEHAPEVMATRAQLVDTDAARDRSHLWPNPVFGASWATIPVGPRTGGAAFWQVPSYSVGVSTLIEIGKRGPRQEAAAAARNGARFDSLEAYRRSFFAVLETLADQAAATMRAAVLRRLVSSSEESLGLQRARAERGDVAALEVDRSRVEHLRLQSALRGTEAEKEAAVLACTRALGTDCPRFSTEDEAARFLDGTGAATHIQDAARIWTRADVQAFRAEDVRLRAESALAARLKIPDLTLGAVFTHDAFVLAGNQANSFALSVAFPLPTFDRGQVETIRTERRRAENSRMIDVVAKVAALELELGHRQLTVLQERARALDEQALPQAREVLDRTEAAARRGGAALPDILLVRRALEELALDRVEVLAAIRRATLELRRAAGDLPPPRSP